MLQQMRRNLGKFWSFAWNAMGRVHKKPWCDLSLGTQWDESIKIHDASLAIGACIDPRKHTLINSSLVLDVIGCSLHLTFRMRQGDRLDSREQSCLASCQDQYLEIRNQVQRALEQRQANGMMWLTQLRYDASNKPNQTKSETRHGDARTRTERSCAKHTGRSFAVLRVKNKINTYY